MTSSLPEIPTPQRPLLVFTGYFKQNLVRVRLSIYAYARRGKDENSRVWRHFVGPNIGTHHSRRECSQMLSQTLVQTGHLQCTTYYYCRSEGMEPNMYSV